MCQYRKITYIGDNNIFWCWIIAATKYEIYYLKSVKNILKYSPKMLFKMLYNIINIL